MNKHINFEDNIFVINLQIRLIQDILILDTDTGIFLHKTLEDLDFINSGLNSLLSALKDNFRLIERDEQFYNLMETERQFCEVLGEIERGDGNISVQRFPDLRDRLELFLDRSLDRQNNIKDLIVESKHLTLEPVVGYDELHELLSS